MCVLAYELEPGGELQVSFFFEKLPGTFTFWLSALSRVFYAYGRQ